MKPYLVLATVLLATTSARAADAEVLARVGDTEVKSTDLRPIIDALPPADRAALDRDPGLLNQAVRSLLVQQLLVKEALAKGWDKDPAVAAQLERQRQTALAESYLRSLAKVPAGFPTDAEIQAAYDENQAALVVPRQLELAQIFVALPPDAAAAATEKATADLAAVVKEVKAPGADFAAVATARSGDAASAPRGGSLGWLTESQLQPEIRAAVTGLAKGAVSEPVRLSDGWHVIKVLGIREPRTATLDEVREQLKERLVAARLRENSNTVVTAMLEKNPVAINEIALSQLLELPGKNEPKTKN